MIINEPFPRHLNDPVRFPQSFTGGKSRRKSRRSPLCKMCKSRPCKCKSCKKCMASKCKCKRCKRRCSSKKLRSRSRSRS